MLAQQAHTAEATGTERQERLSRWVDSQISTDERGYNTASPDLEAYVRRRSMGVPEEHGESTLENFWVDSADRRAAQAAVDAWAIDWTGYGRHSLWIEGSVGTGKTHLGIGVLKRMVSKKINGEKLRPKFVHFARVLDLLGGYSRDGYDPVEDYGKEVDCLMVDDFGDPTMLQAKGGKLTRGGERMAIVLKMRIANRLPTIVTTNLTLSGQALARELDDRIISRIFDSFRRVEVKGADYRRYA